MGLEDIIRKIKEEAKKEAEKLLSEAKEREGEMIKKAREESERVKGGLVEEGRKNAQAHKERLISVANLDMRKEVLKEKQNLIDTAFRKALERLINMEDEEYKGLMRKMLRRFVEHGDEEIILCKRDKFRIGQEFIQALNQELKLEGKMGKLTIAEETRDFSGGFILRRGKVEMNNTFDALLQAVRNELETEVSRILFGEQGFGE